MYDQSALDTCIKIQHSNTSGFVCMCTTLTKDSTCTGR